MRLLRCRRADAARQPRGMSSWAAIEGTGSDGDTESASPHAVEARRPQAWQAYFKAAMDENGRLREQELRPLSLMSLCSGMCCEAFACMELNIPAEVEATCDPKLLTANFGGASGLPAKHHFLDVFDLFAGDQDDPCAMCARHNDTCTLRMHRDLLIAGFSCQAFAQPGESALGVVGHKDYGLVEGMISSLARLKPHSFIFENVSACARPAQNMHCTPLELFISKLKETNQYWVRAVQLYLSAWVEANRPRRHAGLGGGGGGRRELGSHTRNIAVGPASVVPLPEAPNQHDPMRVRCPHHRL